MLVLLVIRNGAVHSDMIPILSLLIVIPLAGVAPGLRPLELEPAGLAWPPRWSSRWSVLAVAVYTFWYVYANVPLPWPVRPDGEATSG